MEAQQDLEGVEEENKGREGSYVVLSSCGATESFLNFI